MSKLRDQINQLLADQAEAGIVPIRRGGGALTIPIGPDALTEFSTIQEGEVNRGFILPRTSRFISAKLALQRYRDDHDNYKADENDPAGWQFVIDTTFVTRARVGVIEVENGQDTLGALLMEQAVLPLIHPEGPDMPRFIYGHHQGVHPEGAEALHQLLLSKGWVIRAELEGIERKRRNQVGDKIGWNLQTRGALANGNPNVREQASLSNGAIDVQELIVRPTRYTREDSGKVSGFQDFVSADIDNYKRWFDMRLTLGDDATEKQTNTIHQGLTSLTGARTELNDEGELVTYLDRAGIAEFTLLGDPVADPEAQRERIEVSFWASAQAQDEANAEGAVVFDNDRF